MNFLRNLMVFSLFVVSSSSHAQSLEAETVNLYGGSYSIQCEDKQAPSITIYADRLVYKQGARTVVATGPEPIYSSYGPRPPKGFKLSIMGVTRPDVGLNVDIYSLKAKKFLYINGHPEAMKAIGREEDQVPFHFCGK